MTSAFAIPLSAPELPSGALNLDLVSSQAPQELEAAMAASLGRPVVTTSSGTAAIHLALMAAGVGPGHVVVAPAFTFVATLNPIRYCGAEVVLVDAEPTTWAMDAELLDQTLAELAREGKPAKVCLVASLYGRPAHWGALQAVCQRHGVVLVEDAAEALGSSYHDRPCGTLGHFGALSFNTNKVITTGGGGALVCPDEQAARHVRHLANQAKEEDHHYSHSQVGYNYRMNTMAAQVGLQAWPLLPERVERRRDVLVAYQSALASVPGVTFLPEVAGSHSSAWLTTVLFDTEQQQLAAASALHAAGVETRPLWKPMHLQAPYAHCRAYLSGVAERLYRTGLCLPSNSWLTAEQVSQVAQILQKAIR